LYDIDEPSKKMSKTEVLYDIENSLLCGVKFMQNAKKIDIASDKKGPSVFIENDIYKINLIEARKRGAKLRFITDINKDNLHYCKEMLYIADEIRHFEGFKGGLAVSDSEYMGTTELREKQHSIFLIYSNVKELVEQQQIIFNTLWEKAIPAKQRILEIEEGIVPEVIETISNPIDILRKKFCLLNSANDEILIIISTSNAFHRIVDDGSFQKLKETSDNKPWVTIRILTPKDNKIEKIVLGFNNNRNSTVRFIEPLSRVVILLVDRKYSLVAETKYDTKQTVTDARGLVTYSNSVPTVLSYASIFDSLWRQTELYEQLKKAHEKLLIHDRMQKEFIDIAAHELRTPIQPILGISELIKNKFKDKELSELLVVISRNAQRLKKLSENILEVSKIESNLLNLNKEHFKINEIIVDITNCFKNNNDTKGIIFEYVRMSDLVVYADKNSISRVISNLISNSIKFTPQEGIISIGSERKENSNNGDKVDYKENLDNVVVNVKDTGIGIDKEMFTKLFTKFNSKSVHGMGLGLYISKNIIETHGGKIWAKNNKEGEKGATFSFSLPLNDKK
jgi:two-component system sensor histidine kinase VicK